MRSQILSEVFRIREIMGTKSKKVIQEGILDDILELMTKKGVSADIKATLEDYILRQYPNYKPNDVQNMVDGFIRDYKSAANDAERQLALDTYFPRVSDELLVDIFKKLPERTRNLLSLEAFFTKKYGTNGVSYFNQLTYDATRGLTNAAEKDIKDHLIRLNQFKNEMEQLGTTESNEIISAIEKYETTFQSELNTRKFQNTPQPQQSKQLGDVISDWSELYNVIANQLKSKGRKLNINKDQFDELFTTIERSIERGELNSQEDVINWFIEKFGGDRRTAVKYFQEAKDILKETGDITGEGANILTKPIGKLKNNLGITIGGAILIVMACLGYNKLMKYTEKDDDYYWRNSVAGFDDLSDEAQKILMSSINVRNQNIQKMFDEIKSVTENEENNLTVNTVKGSIVFKYDKISDSYELESGQDIIDSYIPDPNKITRAEISKYIIEKFGFTKNMIERGEVVIELDPSDKTKATITAPNAEGQTQTGTITKINENGEISYTVKF